MASITLACAHAASDIACSVNVAFLRASFCLLLLPVCMQAAIDLLVLFMVIVFIANMQAAQERLDAIAQRRKWRRKLGARTAKGQPIMQHIIDKELIKLHRMHVQDQMQAKRATVKESP